ncbi:MAG: hypothetical protein CVT94_13755 [Bacteroidetes bacterium HGW-Bacteroidetes-11]|nr:MAG: hypothetical protein CVT94_13755 [Bacteroidetes bacterium HGW-Bacteroidetes-11]
MNTIEFAIQYFSAAYVFLPLVINELHISLAFGALHKLGLKPGVVVRFFVVIPPGNSTGGNTAGGNSVGYLESYYICLTSRYNFILLLT